MDGDSDAIIGDGDDLEAGELLEFGALDFAGGHADIGGVLPGGFHTDAGAASLDVNGDL